MPTPVDPIRRKEYILKQKLGTLLLCALNASKILVGRKQPQEVVEKRRKTLKIVCNTPEHRQLMSSIANASGCGKWMKGRKLPYISQSNKKTRFGKTYLQLYGERAKEEAQKRKEGNLKRFVGVVRKFDLRPYQNGEAKYVIWRKAVFERDRYACRKCNHGGELHSHHIKPWADFPDLRYEISNGMTLCISCHKEIHKQIRLVAQFLKQLREFKK